METAGMCKPEKGGGGLAPPCTIHDGWHRHCCIDCNGTGELDHFTYSSWLEVEKKGSPCAGRSPLSSQKQNKLSTWRRKSGDDAKVFDPTAETMGQNIPSCSEGWRSLALMRWSSDPEAITFDDSSMNATAFTSLSWASIESTVCMIKQATLTTTSSLCWLKMKVSDVHPKEHGVL